MLYLDTAASYPLLPEVKTALNQAFDECFANPSSNHSLGVNADKSIQKIREQLADEIGALPSEIIFTSGATESNNIALKSIVLGDVQFKDKKHIITSEIEHKCILNICSYLDSIGYEVTYLKPDENGVISSEAVKNCITEGTALVSIMHVNNELGTINPIDEIGEVCFENGVLFHSDAAQSFGKLKIDVDDMNIDLLSISAHKIAGPKGIGAIYIRDQRQKNLQPVIHGAGQEEGLRGGTVAAPLILGFGSAITHFPQKYKSFAKCGIKTHLIKELEARNVPFIVNGGQALESCISITLPKVNVSDLLQGYREGICLSQGSACSSKEIKASHVLTSIGLSREMADQTFRISFPLDISLDDVRSIASMIDKCQLN